MEKDKYISYDKRITRQVLLIMFITLISAVIFSSSLELTDEKNINYQEKGNVSYKVQLKENDFYDNQTQNENMSYVSSLIDKININFNYNFLIDEKIDFDIEHKIIGKLIIEDSENKSKYYEKEYILVDKKKESSNHTDHYTVNTSVDIDYDYYNDIANTFRSKYGISATSYLEVYFKSDRKVNSHLLKNNENITLKIPLSQRAINIKLDTNKFNENRVEKISNKDVKIKNIYTLILSIIIFIVDLFLIAYLIFFINKTTIRKSKYEKELNRILKEYDRFIGNIKRLPSFEGYRKIELNSFQELLDVRDNINKVIMYYEIVKRRKSMFYIIDNNDLYLYILKEADFIEEVL